MGWILWLSCFTNIFASRGMRKQRSLWMGAESPHPPKILPSPRFLQLDPLVVIFAKLAGPLNGRRNSLFHGTNHPHPFYDHDGHLEADGIKDAVSSRWTSISIQTVVSNYSLLVWIGDNKRFLFSFPLQFRNLVHHNAFPTLEVNL